MEEGGVGGIIHYLPPPPHGLFEIKNNPGKDYDFLLALLI